MDARLEIKLRDPSPKCATCGAWVQGYCEQHKIKTLDLAVCSEWCPPLEGEIMNREDGNA